MTNFQVGDRVSWNGYEATIMINPSVNDGYCILFIHDKSFDGHSGGGHLSGVVCGYTEQEYFGHCWNVDANYVKLIEPLCDSGGVIYD